MLGKLNKWDSQRRLKGAMVEGMESSSQLFEAYLKCPTKCWLLSRGEPGEGNAYAEWVKGQNESYRVEGVRRLQEAGPEGECVVAPPTGEKLKAAKWRLAVDLPGSSPTGSDCVCRPERTLDGTPDQTADMRSKLQIQPDPRLLEPRLHAVEHVASEGRGKAAQFVPIRFIFRNKLTRDDRLLAAFDALVLCESLGRDVNLGKIIHGDNHATVKVRTLALVGEVRKRLDEIAALLSNPAPPDLILNRHCAECEFQARCRKIAVEKDDLSLLAGMKQDERKEYNSKGIFTVTQLSYTFRPRRRPKKLRDKREKHHHSLKALAIREKKIHIVGSPEFKIEGMPVYLDVEGLPDRDSYYLIGVRIGNDESAVQHSLWADNVEDEGKIWREFLGILETVEKPVLVHYGSYETTFLHRMCAGFGVPLANAAGVARAIENPVNLLSAIYAQVYFPTFSNGLKEIAGALGFKWSEADASGSRSVIWRHTWNGSRDPAMKEKLITYNAQDCEALGLVERTASRTATHNRMPLEPTEQTLSGRMT